MCIIQKLGCIIQRLGCIIQSERVVIIKCVSVWMFIQDGLFIQNEGVLSVQCMCVLCGHVWIVVS